MKIDDIREALTLLNACALPVVAVTFSPAYECRIRKIRAQADTPLFARLSIIPAYTKRGQREDVREWTSHKALANYLGDNWRPNRK